MRDIACCCRGLGRKFCRWSGLSGATATVGLAQSLPNRGEHGVAYRCPRSHSIPSTPSVFAGVATSIAPETPSSAATAAIELRTRSSYSGPIGSSLHASTAVMPNRFRAKMNSERRPPSSRLAGSCDAASEAGGGAARNALRFLRSCAQLFRERVVAGGQTGDKER